VKPIENFTNIVKTLLSNENKPFKMGTCLAAKHLLK